MDGHNYFFYHTSPTSSSSIKPWTLFDCDFDEIMYFKGYGVPDAKNDIIEYCLYPNTDKHYDPFVSRLFAIPMYLQQYIDLYRDMLTSIFGSTSAQQPIDRYARIMQFIEPYIYMDKIWQVSKGVSNEDFIIDCQNTMRNLQWRYANVSAQVEQFNIEKYIK